MGYGFVNFLRMEDAEKAVKNMNGLRLQNKTIKVSSPLACIGISIYLSMTLEIQVSFARPSSESIKYSNLYISNLPRSMSQQELESLFADFGSIISSKILCNPKAGRSVELSKKKKSTSRIILGASKSVGFIRFDQRAEAEAAISKLNGTIPKGKSLSNRFSSMTLLLAGFTDPITVKFANTPNAAKSMIGLPLAPSYLPAAIPTSQSTVLTTIPPIRQQLNRYRYALLN